VRRRDSFRLRRADKVVKSDVEWTGSEFVKQSARWHAANS